MEFQNPTHRTVLLHTRRGNVIRLSREHYIREDIDCRMPGRSDSPFPTPEVNYIIVLDSETILNQIDSFQNENIINAIILETSYETVKQKSKAKINQLNKILKTPEKHFMVFANDHYRPTYVEQPSDLTSQQHKEISIIRALQFLGQPPHDFPIIYLTNTVEDMERYRQLAKDLEDKEKFPDTQFLIDNIHSWAEDKRGLPELLLSPDLAKGDETVYPEHLSVLDAHALVNEGKGFVGIFNLSQFSREEGTVRTPKNGEILIQSKINQNRAIDGDTVVVELLPESEYLVVNNEAFPTGKIVSILKSPTRIICGTIQEPPNITNDWQYVIVVPMDSNLPKIRIRTRQVQQLLGARVQVSIDGWNSNSKYPYGHYIATIGYSGDIHTESEVILLTHQIPHQNFPPAVIECLPPEDYQPTEAELAVRRDLRDRLVCSIDPPGCVDIDDALHYKDLNETECEVGIHIADVSYFVREGTAIDLEARERGTTVYLTERRINMLPGLLSENLCSLMGNVERFAFSVVATLDKKTADTKFIWFGRTIIRNRDAMSYQKAQSMVDDPNDHSELAEGIRQLLRLSKLMKQKRFDAGALKLSSPQLHFVLDSETQEPKEGEIYQLREVNSLVEEFMLYANIEVAKRIYQEFPQSAMLRRHESPLAARFDYINHALKRYDVQIDPDSNKLLSESLDLVKDKVPQLDDVVRIMTTRCMQLAKYFASGTQDYDHFAHYGLAMPIYTHFTSPIRRYADLIVHRQLAVACGAEPPTEMLTSKSVMNAIADNLNFRHHMAQQAGRDSSQLFMMELLRKTPNKQERGRVIKIKPTVFSVLLEKQGVEGHVHVDGEEWRYDEEEELLQKGDFVIRIFDTVTVKINVTPMNMHGRSRLDLQLVEQ